MSNAAKITTPGGSDNGKAPVYNSGTDTFDLVDITTAAELTTHEADTTSVHGITDTTQLVRSVAGLTAGSGNATANTAAIQAALDAAETAGGGVVLIPAGTWYINATLNLGSRVVLKGAGNWNSRITFANGTSTHASPKAMVKAKAATNYCGVEDLYLDGNKANQTDSTNYVSHGVDFSRTTTEGVGPPVYDGGMFCRNVMVYACQGTGFYVRGDATTMRLHNCYAYHNDAEGFNGKTDLIWSGCVAANNGGYGYLFQNGTSIVGVGLKGFGNSQRYLGADFYMVNCNTVLLTGCQAEDSCEAGFYIATCSHVTLTGCQSYRMGSFPGISTNNRAGFRIEDDGAGGLCHDVKITGSVLGGGSGSMRYALTTRNLGEAVDVQLSTETLAVARWNHISGTQDAKVVFDNATLDAVQTVAYAASVTPVPYSGGTVILGALTGNITIGAVAEPYVGQALRFRFLQDGTGGRTVTWNAVYDTAWQPVSTASAASSVTFQYDGTKWRHVATGPEGTIATQNANNVTITGGSITGITDVAVADGGTGASTAAGARTNLGLVIGTDVEAHDADLTAIAALTSAADKVPYATGAQAWALADLTSAGRALIDDASVAAQRVTLRVDQRVTVNNTTYTVLSTDTYVAQTGTMSASRAFTLPAASAFTAGQEVVIADESGTVTSTNTIVITRAGSDTINGATTETIATAYGWRRLISDGTSKWSFDGGVVRQSLATAKGDILAATAASTLARLAVGTDGQVLTADAASTPGVKWATPSGGSGSVATDTIFDAKGDLPVGTGSDTAAKLTVGANGTSIFADSSQTTGLRYAYVSPAQKPSSSRQHATFRTNGSAAPTLNRLWYAPMFVAIGHAYTNFGISVTVASSSGVVRIGIYSPTAAGLPGSLITDGGTASTTTTGQKLVSISYTPTVPVVWVAAVAQTDVTSLTMLSANNNAGWSTNFLSLNNGENGGIWYESSVSGSLPSTATPAAVDYGPVMFAY